MQSIEPDVERRFDTWLTTLCSISAKTWALSFITIERGQVPFGHIG
jgi:hypothetical protein